MGPSPYYIDAMCREACDQLDGSTDGHDIIGKLLELNRVENLGFPKSVMMIVSQLLNMYDHTVLGLRLDPRCKSFKLGCKSTTVVLNLF